MTPDFYRHPAKPFSRRVLNAAGKHAAIEAARETPRESCGLVIAGRYQRCENTAEDPAAAFTIGADQLAHAYSTGDLQAVIHSHPGGPWWPSLQDMRGQAETGVPWAILVPGEDGAALACWWGAGMPRPPVFDRAGDHVPRAFLPGVSDCYTLMQDVFAELHGVALPDVPRAWEWWTDTATHGSLYLDNLTRAGFEVISTDPLAYADIAQPGDAYLMTIRSKVPNHAGAYLGEGLLLEHVQGRLSHREPIGRKLRHVTHWLRRTGEVQA